MTLSPSMRAALSFAGISGVWCVAMGAAASHALAGHMSAEDLLRVEKAVSYQFYHTLALLAAVLLNDHYPHRILRMAAMLFALGIIGFCGSLYLRVFFPDAGIPGFAPLGGIAWMVGWFLLGVSGWLVQRSK